MRQRVLLLDPPFMDICKDIISSLKAMDYDVVWVADGSIPNNPYNKMSRNRHKRTIEEYQKEVNVFWNDAFKTEKFAKPFDFFLAIDGFMVTPELFERLIRQNPKIRKVLFLYDRVEGNYELDMFFKYYDDVYSFEIHDCKHYGLHHLPIYWNPAANDEEVVYDISGMASFKWGSRYEMYKRLKTLARQNGLTECIKLYHRPIRNRFTYSAKYLTCKILGRNFLSLSDLKDDIFTFKILSSTEFRKNILQSKAVLDTHNNFQDGLTARFMWALGCGRKIVTTNKSVVQYPFYDPAQIYLIDDTNVDGVVDFIKAEYSMSQSMRQLIEPYRIDNWIRQMFKTELC